MNRLFRIPVIRVAYVFWYTVATDRSLMEAGDAVMFHFLNDGKPTLRHTVASIIRDTPLDR